VFSTESILKFRFLYDAILFASGRPQRWATTSFRPTIGRRWMIRPSPQLFTPDFRPSHGQV